MKPILSILICTLTARRTQREELERHLTAQVQRLKAEKLVEIIHYEDEGQLATGAKRNALLDQAQGLYVVFIDDDDWVADSYVGEILFGRMEYLNEHGGENNPDCISIDGWMTTDGRDRKEWRQSIKYDYVAVMENGKEVYLRHPNHITPILREHALKARFPEISNHEDYQYAVAVRPHLKTEARVPKPLYHYRYARSNKTYH